MNSDDAKFKGKSKAERINMALGAYYAAQRSVKEGVEGIKADFTMSLNTFKSDYDDGAEVSVHTPS